MTAVETRGAGRRLTPEQEERGRQLFAEGRTEREVAKALQVGTGTAHRIRERAEAAAAEAAPAAPAALAAGEHDPAGMAVTPGTDEPAETLVALRDRRDKLAAQHGALLDQAQAAREAVEDCDARRLDQLAGGGDSARFAAERTRLEADHTRLSADAGVVGRWLLEVDAEIERRERVRELHAMRRELAAAVTERDSVCARTGERMRGAVLAVRDAAAEFVQALADDQAAVQRAQELAAAVTGRAAELGEPGPDVPPAQSTILDVSGDYVAAEPVALIRAVYHARAGNVQRVAAELGNACGWLPPDPAVLAAEQERLLALQPPAPAEDHQPWTRDDPGSVPLDADGNELPQWPMPMRVPARSPLGW